MNRLVARYTDGTMVKGTAVDFATDRRTFHITETTSDSEWDRTEVYVDDLKALFFVRDYDGDPYHVDRLEFDFTPPPSEKAVIVHFKDGETMTGTTPAYQSSHGGFFLVPADPRSNNERCYVLESAVREVLPA